MTTSSEIKLGELEFKAEDFDLCKDELTQERMTQRAAHLANSLLRERLKKTPEVYGIGYCFGQLKPETWGSVTPGEDTHSARLVCIAEMEHG